MADTRIAYGARCTWWDGIANVGLTEPGRSGHRIPCCPQCGSMLFEMESEEPWWEGVRKHESNGNPGYHTMMEWARGRCFPNLASLEMAYAAATMVRETLPSAADLALAQDIIDSSPVINIFASCEWGELSQDGQVWVAAIVAEATKRALPRSAHVVPPMTNVTDADLADAFKLHPSGEVDPLIIAALVAKLRIATEALHQASALLDSTEQTDDGLWLINHDDPELFCGETLLSIERALTQIKD